MARSSVIMELSMEEAKLLQGYQRAIQENQKFKQELQDLKKKGRESSDWTDGFGKSVASAFNPGAIASFAGTLAGVGGGLSVASALSQIVNLAGEAREEIKGMADELKANYDTAKGLWQLVGSRREYAELSKSQRVAMAKEGITREEAGQLLFNLKSLGKEEALPEITAASRFMDPTVASKYYTTATDPLSFGDAAGDPKQVLSGLLAGAKASKFNTDETAEWFLRAAPTQANLGTSQAELLAVGASIAGAAPNPEELATFFTAANANLSQWKAEAIATAEKPATEAPTAPEKPKHEPPEKPERIYSTPQAAANAELAYKDRLESYEKRHAEDMAEWQEKETKYQAELTAWNKERADAKRIAAAAGKAQGVTALFEAMRHEDPEAYQDARLANVRFDKFATNMEKGLEKAKQLQPVIETEIQSGTLFDVQTEARPRQLTEQQRLRQAEELNKLAAEDKAEEENRLRTTIASNKAFANFTGQSEIATKAWEKVIEQGATIVDTQAANQQATDALVDAIYQRRPDLFEQHLKPLVPVLEYDRQGMMGSMGYHVEDPQVTAKNMGVELSTAIATILETMAQEKIEGRYTADVAEANEQATRDTGTPHTPPIVQPTPPATAMPPADPTAKIVEPGRTSSAAEPPPIVAPAPAVATIAPPVDASSLQSPSSPAAIVEPVPPIVDPRSTTDAGQAPQPKQPMSGPAGSDEPAYRPDPPDPSNVTVIVPTPAPAPDIGTHDRLDDILATLRDLRDVRAPLANPLQPVGPLAAGRDN